LSRCSSWASRALELDPDYATAYAAQAIAYTYQGRHDEADASARSAIDSNPNDPDVLGRAAQVLSFSGKHKEAIEILKKAIALDPYGPAEWFNFLSRAYFFTGQTTPRLNLQKRVWSGPRFNHVRKPLRLH
jgi:adenylate cyclase